MPLVHMLAFLLGSLIVFLSLIWVRLLEKKKNETRYELVLEHKERPMLEKIKKIEKEHQSKFTVNELAYERVFRKLLLPKMEGKWAVVSSKKDHKVEVFDHYSTALQYAGICSSSNF